MPSLPPSLPPSRLQAKNEADTAIYSAEKSLTEYKAKLPQAVIDEINKALEEAREASQVRACARQ